MLSGYGSAYAYAGERALLVGSAYAYAGEGALRLSRRGKGPEAGEANASPGRRPGKLTLPPGIIIG